MRGDSAGGGSPSLRGDWVLAGHPPSVRGAGVGGICLASEQGSLLAKGVVWKGGGLMAALLLEWEKK